MLIKHWLNTDTTHFKCSDIVDHHPDNVVVFRLLSAIERREGKKPPTEIPNRSQSSSNYFNTSTNEHSGSQTCSTDQDTCCCRLHQAHRSRRFKVGTRLQWRETNSENICSDYSVMSASPGLRLLGLMGKINEAVQRAAQVPTHVDTVRLPEMNT